MDCWSAELLTQPGIMLQKGTDWKLPRHKTDPCCNVAMREEKHLSGTMPMSMGIRDPRGGTQEVCGAP